MKNINLYITEKLHLNKDIQIDKFDEQGIYDIIVKFLTHDLHYDENEDYEVLTISKELIEIKYIYDLSSESTLRSIGNSLKIKLKDILGNPKDIHITFKHNNSRIILEY